VSLALLRQNLSEIIESTRPGTPGLPTGLSSLDSALPNRGLPRGRLTELVGLPGCGKTTVVRQIIERAVADGWWVAYIDATRTLAPRDWAHVGANNKDGLWVVRPDNPQRGAWCADVLLRSGAFTLVVLDGAPLLTRTVAVRLTRLARESDAALLVLGDDAKASDLAGSLRLRVEKRKEMQDKKEMLSRRRTPAAFDISVVIEKGAPYQTVKVFSSGEVDRDIEVARRVCTHSEVPDRRSVVPPKRFAAQGQPLGHAADRARRGNAPDDRKTARRELGGGEGARARGDVDDRGEVALRRARGVLVG